MMSIQFTVKVQMIDALERLFIRPTRHIYRTIDLGPEKIKIHNKLAFRKDISILNRDNKNIQVSCFLFEPLHLTRDILVYCHCNSGSRVEGISVAKSVLEAGIPFLVFDFSGSGLSGGDYVTLGLNESKDLEVIVTHLRKFNPKIKVGLWGRSMGAVACLLFLEKHPQMVQVGIYDSPFSSLRELALDIGNDKTNIPKIFLQGLVGIFNHRLKLKTKDDLFEKLDVDKLVGEIRCPGLFLGSKEDSLIPFKHIECLYQNYGGIKEIYYLSQDHHQKRLAQSIAYVLKFVSKHLKTTKPRHKKSTSNLVSSLRDNHSASQLDIRYSFDHPRKLELVCMTTRKVKHAQYFTKAKEEKKKFLYLTQLSKENDSKEKEREGQKPKKIKLMKPTSKVNKPLRTPFSEVKS